MKKFNLKKCLTENKHGKAPSFSNYSGRFGKINEQGTYASNQAYTGDDTPDDSGFISGDQLTQSDFDFNTDCAGFNEVPQDFQDLICSSCDNGQISMHCECCEEGVNWFPEEEIEAIPPVPPRDDLEIDRMKKLAGLKNPKIK